VRAAVPWAPLLPPELCFPAAETSRLPARDAGEELGGAGHLPVQSGVPPSVGGYPRSHTVPYSISAEGFSNVFLSLQDKFLSCVENLAAVPFIHAAIIHGASELTEIRKTNNIKITN